MLTEKTVALDDVRLCYFESGSQFRASGTCLLVHATGFHARCWDRTIELLGERHVIAVDMRGHGRSDKTAPYDWRQFGSDVTQLVEALDLSGVVGVGHSMGGHSVTQAAASLPTRFARLVLLDPVILSTEAYQNHPQDPAVNLNAARQHPVARRRNFFDSPDAMFANFEGRGSYGLWREDVLRDYCNHGVLPNPDGPGFILACPPDVEALIYIGTPGTDILDQVAQVQIPVTVLRAEKREANRNMMDFSKSPTWDQLASQFPQGRDVYLPQLSHFIPMQDPALTARYILGQS
jgi:lipase